jgi:hypothetical protein
MPTALGMESANDIAYDGEKTITYKDSEGSRIHMAFNVEDNYCGIDYSNYSKR